MFNQPKKKKGKKKKKKAPPKIEETEDAEIINWILIAIFTIKLRR